MIQPLLVFSNWGLLVLRIILGVIFVSHGKPKLWNLKGTVQNFKNMNIRSASFWTVFIAILEFFGGISLILGFLTQIFALFFIIQFLFIILKIKFKSGLINGYELDLLILAGVFVLFTNGGGFYSLDDFFGILIY